ncbi:MAG TPA: DUF2235 domain-containing protein [Cyclobacteriaceae bacterium]|nr:DUF2235 domain-containing protein [Cyclobacteriaceae bacterium]
MPKNIIVCCDGTGNQFDESYSNVVKIFTIIKKDQTQLAYYDPGVGTLNDESAAGLPGKWRKVKSLAFGSGLEKNVKEAYSYLMENYHNGDQLFLFGFSRGAFTVRVLAGFIHQVGILEKGCQNLIPYAWDTYRKTTNKTGQELAAEFRTTFSRTATIHFLGLWDTVTSMGLFNWRRYPNTTNNGSVVHIRHAISIDERRTFFRQNLFGAYHADGTVKQVWFVGVHADVGGSYPFNESGLAQVALQWMAKEAKGLALAIDEEQETMVLYDQTGHNSPPDYRGEIHPSLSGAWKLLEYIPRVKLQPFRLMSPGRGRPRELFHDAKGEPCKPTIHQSVKDRINDQALGYKPLNLTDEQLKVCETEPW